MARVFADWSGAGSLFESLSSAGDDLRQWTPEEIRSRATRILLLENRDLLDQLPQTSSGWLQWLPISTDRSGRWSSTIRGRADWRKTASRKWPPDEVFVRRKRRVIDNLPASILAWTFGRISIARSSQDEDFSTNSIEGAILAMGSVVAGLEGVDTTEPQERELLAVRALGGPWPLVSTLALRLKTFEMSGAEEYARRLIQPDIADRLFQLGILGEVILGVELAGGSVVSLRPITGSPGPVYSSGDAYWSIWWEGASIWNYLGISNLRQKIAQEAFSSIGRTYVAKPDRPDILLVGANREILVLESKYPLESGNRGYVASGVAQAFFYAKQLAEVSELTHAFSVGPSSIVRNTAHRTVDGIRIGMAPSTHVSSLVQEFIASNGKSHHSADLLTSI